MIADIIRDTKHSLVISDSAAWVTACLGVFLGTRLLFGWRFLDGRTVLVCTVLLALWVVSLALMGCYDAMAGLRPAAALFSGSFLFLAFGTLVGFQTGHPRDAVRLLLIAALALGIASLFRSRLSWRIRRWLRGSQYETVVVLGHNGLSESTTTMLRHKLRLAAAQAPFPEGAAMRERLVDLIANSKAKEVLCVANEAPPDAMQFVKDVCQQYHVGWQFVLSQKDQDGHQFESLSLGGISFSGPKGSAITGFNRFYKAMFDICVGSMLLIIATPVMILVAIAIRLTSPGPAILAQERVGILGNRFKMYKFRTMYNNANDKRHREYVQNWMKNQAHTESRGQKIFKITNDDRITPLGRFLRRYSLDELPQIFNVLKLEMSLVGPRPAMPYELDGYSLWHFKRLEGPPGLTGPWQVNGRNRLSFDEMVQLDVSYLQNWSPMRDLVLIGRTVPAIFLGKGH